MGWVFAATFTLFIILILIMITPIQISFVLKIKGKRQDVYISIKVWNLFKKEYRIPVISVDEHNKTLVIKEEKQSSLSKPVEKDIEETPEDLKRQLETIKLFVNHVNGLISELKKLTSRIKLKHFEWKSEIGTSDAAWDGFLSGMLWAVKGTAAGVGAEFFKLRCEPSINVQPNFQKAVFNTDFSCIVALKLGHAIIAGIRVLRHLNGSMFSLLKKAKDMNMNNKEAS